MKTLNPEIIVDVEPLEDALKYQSRRGCAPGKFCAGVAFDEESIRQRCEKYFGRSVHLARERPNENKMSHSAGEKA